MSLEGATKDSNAMETESLASTSTQVPAESSASTQNQTPVSFRNRLNRSFNQLRANATPYMQDASRRIGNAVHSAGQFVEQHKEGAIVTGVGTMWGFTSQFLAGQGNVVNYAATTVMGIAETAALWFGSKAVVNGAKAAKDVTVNGAKAAMAGLKRKRSEEVSPEQNPAPQPQTPAVDPTQTQTPVVDPAQTQAPTASSSQVSDVQAAVTPSTPAPIANAFANKRRKLDKKGKGKANSEGEEFDAESSSKEEEVTKAAISEDEGTRRTVRAKRTPGMRRASGLGGK